MESAALAEVCARAGLHADGAYLMHHRSNAVYRLPQDHVVARLAPDTPVRRQRAEVSIAVCRWLAEVAPGLALPPTNVDQPIMTGGFVATIWPYHPAADLVPPPEVLGLLLRRLHALPTPPFSVPTFQPFDSLTEALRGDASRDRPVLSPDDHAWLADHMAAIVTFFDTTEFPLGYGLLHGDAHNENLVPAGDGWAWIDWDKTCVGPRELDLVSALPDHFHEPAAERTALLRAYEYDLTEWPSWPWLRDHTELSALSSYIRLASTRNDVAVELRRRVTSLRDGNRDVVWRAVA